MRLPCGVRCGGRVAVDDDGTRTAAAGTARPGPAAHVVTATPVEVPVHRAGRKNLAAAPRDSECAKPRDKISLMRRRAKKPRSSVQALLFFF